MLKNKISEFVEDYTTKRIYDKAPKPLIAIPATNGKLKSSSKLTMVPDAEFRNSALDGSVLEEQKYVHFSMG